MTGRNLLGVVGTEEKESGVSEGVRAGFLEKVTSAPRRDRREFARWMRELSVKRLLSRVGFV